MLPPSYPQQYGHAERIELASDRMLRTRNKISYRIAHWPIWIWVFFTAPGPITYNFFAYGPDPAIGAWFLAVLIGTGIAGWRGKLPGVEPRPYILRFSEDRPNPLYRRICYTLAWSEIVSYALLNSIGLVDAIVNGVWRMRQVYDIGYFPIAGTIWLLGAAGWLPRVKVSTRGEGHERRYFYGSLWAICIAQPVLWATWKTLPVSPEFDALKLAVFWGILLYVGNLARRGLLPRTRPILPGQLAVSD